MSTPQWPVPYYQRAFRHEPRQPENSYDYMTLEDHHHGLTDGDVIVGKEVLRS